MQPIRITTRRLPQVYRIIPSRNISNTRNTMSLFPRFAQEFSPHFRILNEYDQAAQQFTNTASTHLRSFQPKFDVKELKDSYELHGELPGIDQKDVSIEWTDGTTLAIKGRTEKHVERGTRPAAIEEAPKSSGAIQAAPEAETSTPASEHNFHKASVSEEGEDDASTVAGDHNALTPATTNAGEVAKPAESQEPEAKFWVSERSVGEFHRSFTFPTRVDHDGVKASLKNGILSIVVPKAQAPKARKIEIQ
jgi:HSP20 family molecular chaperone IbpA